MRKSLLYIFSLFAVSLHAQEVVNGSIMHDGIERDYILYIPETFVEGNPLVMNFHGYGSNAFEQMLYSDFLSIADEEGFLLVHPDGTEDLLGTTHWNVGWGASSVDDVGFVDALIDSLHSEYSMNLERIYSTGMSNGGFFSYELACQLSERIAAIASVTGTMTSGAFNTCNSQHPMPVMEIHGTADGTVAYEGTAFFEGTEDVIDYWVNFNEITSAPIVTAIPDTDPDDGCTAERWLYENGNNGVDVELYKVIDGGHTWPGASVIIGTTNQDFDASQVIWEFFSQYDINGEILPNGIEELDNSANLHLWPNPCSDILHIKGLQHPMNYKIHDVLGKQVIEGKLVAGQNTISVGYLIPGLYIFSPIHGSSLTFEIED